MYMVDMRDAVGDVGTYITKRGTLALRLRRNGTKAAEIRSLRTDAYIGPILVIYVPTSGDSIDMQQYIYMCFIQLI